MNPKPIAIMDAAINSTTVLISTGTSLITLTPAYATTGSMNNQPDAKSGLSPLTKMQIILYILMAFAGAIGNTLTIAVLLKAKFRKRKSSILLLNLAVCDAIIAILCIPLDVGSLVSDGWIYGKALCYIISPFQTSMPIVSSWSFMYMMLERNSLFTTSVRGQMRRKCIRLLALSTWMLPVALVIPYGIQLRLSNKNGVIRCQEEWGSKIAPKLYTVLLSVFEFLIPMLIITGFVIRICINLSQQSKSLKKNSLGLNQEKRNLRLKQNKNITIMFIVMVSLYAVLKLPNNIFWQWMEFGSSTDDDKKHLIWTFVSLAAYSTSMVNPIVLAAMSKEFRAEFRYILRCQVFSSIQAICIVFQTARRGTTASESSQGSCSNPCKIVNVEMGELGTMNSTEASTLRGIVLFKKSKENTLIGTESAPLKENVMMERMNSDPEEI